MQFLICQLDRMPEVNTGQMLGWAIVSALLVQVILLSYSSLQTALASRDQRRLTRQRLELDIRTALLQLKDAEQNKLLWNGYRKFKVSKREKECEDVFSFYLTPHDGKPLPGFKPGQYLTFQLNIPGHEKAFVRCYSLSESPNHPDYYRVTIKRALPPAEIKDGKPGVASTYFCDHVKEGDILNVKAPSGHFHLDVTKDNPVVLISGGVGITPMLSMMNSILESGSNREIWFFFGARNRHEHIQKKHLERVAAQHRNVRLHVCYSRPLPDDRPNEDYQHSGRLTIDLIKQLLPPSDTYDFYLCGPGSMMKGITDGLHEWGVSDERVHFEAFGPATVKKAAPAPSRAEASQTAGCEINFSRSGKVCSWSPASGSLLELAEGMGVRIEASCRAGSCGSCLVAMKSGGVEYLTEPGFAVEDGSCLACICKPKGNLVLDA